MKRTVTEEDGSLVAKFEDTVFGVPFTMIAVCADPEEVDAAEEKAVALCDELRRSMH